MSSHGSAAACVVGVAARRTCAAPLGSTPTALVSIVTAWEPCSSKTVQQLARRVQVNNMRNGVVREPCSNTVQDGCSRRSWFAHKLEARAREYNSTRASLVKRSASPCPHARVCWNVGMFARKIPSSADGTPRAKVRCLSVSCTVRHLSRARSPARRCLECEWRWQASPVRSHPGPCPTIAATEDWPSHSHLQSATT